MTRPTNKHQLLARMHESHQTFEAMLDRIPEERMDEIALYDNWSIKDFIAHIGWWEHTAAERMAAIVRGEHPDLPHGSAPLNAEIQERYRETPLYEVRAMESRSFHALLLQVEQTSEKDIFDLDRFEAARDYPLLQWIADSSYDHYAEHLPNVRAWMRLNGLD
jgi:hypothetical protein